MPEYIVLDKQIYNFENFLLLPIRDMDKFKIMKWRNEQLYHLRQKEKLTKKDQVNYFKNTISKLFNNTKPPQILFSFLENNICVGYGGLVHINWEDKNAEISFLIQTKLEKKNFDKYWVIFLNLIEDVAFNQLSLHKIYTYAFDIRPHLYKSLEKVGFEKEGILKEHCIFNKVYKNVVIHSKINMN